MSGLHGNQSCREEPNVNVHRICIVLLISLTACWATGNAVSADVGDSQSNAPEQNADAEPSELKLREVWLHSTGKGYFVYEATVEQETAFTIPVRSDEVSDIVRHAIVLDPQSLGRVMMPSKPDPQTPRITLPRTDTQADLLLSMRGQVVTVVHRDRETIHGRLVSLELRTEIVEEQRIEFEYITIATDAGLRSMPLAEISRIEAEDERFNERLNLALDRMIADDSVATTEVTVRFEAGKQRQVQVHLLREMPIWKVSYLTTVDSFLMRATVDNTTSEDWSDVRVILKTGRPMSFDMDVSSIVRAQRQQITRPLPTLRVAPMLAESNAWTQTPPAGGDIFGDMPGMADPFGGSGSDPFGDIDSLKPGMNGMGMGGGGFGGGMGGMGGMAGGGTPQRQAGSATTKLPDTPGVVEANDQAAGAALVVTCNSVDLPAGQMILLDTTVDKVNGEIVSVYRATDGNGQPMLSLKIRPDVPFVLPAGPLTVYSEDDNYGGEAIMPAITPGVDRLIPFATDQAMRVEQLPTKTDVTHRNVRLVVDEFVLKYETLTNDTISYRIDNRDQQPRTILIEHPRPQSPVEVVLDDDDETEPTEDAIRFQELVPAGATVQLDVNEMQVDELVKPFSDISSKELRKWIGDETLDAEIRDVLNKVLQQQIERYGLRERLAEIVASKIEIASEIQRVTKQLKPTSELGTGLSEALTTRYETKLIELETERDELTETQTELNSEIKTIETALGMHQPKSIDDLF
jgi:hypothetical protein